MELADDSQELPADRHRGRPAGVVEPLGDPGVDEGAGGEVRGVQVMLDRVQLGNREVQSVPAVVLPEGLGVSLLGQSFLEKVGRVEISGNTMVLGEKP